MGSIAESPIAVGCSHCYCGNAERLRRNKYTFSRSRNMLGAHRNLNGLRDLTTPLSGVVG